MIGEIDDPEVPSVQRRKQWAQESRLSLANLATSRGLSRASSGIDSDSSSVQVIKLSSLAEGEPGSFRRVRSRTLDDWQVAEHGRGR
eukprot:CAMPEP_0194487794 /NCGR_PEP_ID=MMETSP0253-20130528/7959_1 /TAXON_ID=2966 /ORGANISM="Noctiluca scintillans" /LENGTH=86 /DNA_ID=CAMNT_0039328063 /DNA_START=202 /DNA_END=463 /DNA_ORIENTATION=-